jgi:hypothetical protein
VALPGLLALHDTGGGARIPSPNLTTSILNYLISDIKALDVWRTSAHSKQVTSTEARRVARRAGTSRPRRPAQRFRRSLCRNRQRLTTVFAVLSISLIAAPLSYADGGNDTVIPNNQRLNNAVIANVYTVQHQAGCTNDVKRSPPR